MPEEEPPSLQRRLTWPWFLVVTVAYLAIIQGAGILVGVDTSGAKGDFPTTEAVLRDGLIPVALSVLFGAAVVTRLGWWGDVLHYRAPVRRWVWCVPISMLAAALLAVNYGHLAAQPLSLGLSLLAMTLLVGIGEELMFRGIGVQVFKKAGLGEGKVALWSSLIFGAAHLSNALSDGGQAIGQAVIVSTSGFFLYLCLRAGGTVLLPMLVHGLWDFGLLSSMAGTDPEGYPGIAVPILLQVVLIVLLVVRRRSITPAPPHHAAAPGAPLPEPAPER
ncbi:lysostaphin resistance A-like protein [Streptomyces sp. NPDC088090]|uniref:CPBP family intramembrane glutamic endopeptidase n=1 Tax=Streptomyces sp. NPDC088090 TaxID=3365822 RepID=UPI00384F2335